MKECFGRNYILNGALNSSELFDNSLVYEGESVYEVLRLIRGVPLFFSDHISRLGASADFQKKPLPASYDELQKDVLLLLNAEQKTETNLKIVFNYNNGKTNRLVYFIEPVYPSPEQYEKGVEGILFYAERKDPESKVVNNKLRSEINHRLITENGYEALLVNSDNCITEGSRSNIFFIKGQKLFTAPESVVLSGITRRHIIEICRGNGVSIELECINADRLPEFESVFMSGTSPVVLPFFRIGETRFAVKHPLISFLTKHYHLKAEESMRKFQEQRGHL